MSLLEIPKAGFTLHRDIDSQTHSTRPPQVMRLNLKKDTTDDLLRLLRSKDKARIRFGAKQAILYGDKQYRVYAQPEIGRSELYKGHSGKEGLFFTGELSHKLESENAQQATSGADAALAELQKSLKSIQEHKASNETRIVPGRAPSPVSRHRKTLSKSSTHLSPYPNSRLLNGKPISSPNSPSLNAYSNSNTPRLAPTSVPSGPSLSKQDQIRLNATKTPLIHLLAIEPLTVKAAASKVHCSKDDCKRLLNKYAQEVRTEPGKFELRDKTHKDLDVWKFRYLSHGFRQKAIDRAITAFDRMKVTRKDEAWQLLLPTSERGKGKVLSRLNLEGAPRPITSKPAESDGEAKSTPVVERGRLAAGPNKSTARSSSQHSTNGKQAQSETDEGKQKPKAKSTVANHASTTKKPARSEKSKYKSAEYVQDSDSDLDMSDVPLAKKAAIIQQAKKETTKPKAASQVSHATVQKERAQYNRSPLGRHEESAQRPSAYSRSRTDSSPQKPSPLASSPPTNATDVDSSGKNSDSSITTSPPQSDGKSSKTSKQVSGPRPETPIANGVKRKAETQDERAAIKRHQPNGNDRGRSQNIVDQDRNAMASQVQPSNHKPVSRLPGGGSSSGSASPPDREQVEAKARQFKDKWERYRKFHEEVSTMAKPRTEDLDKLKRMQDRIRDLKQEIWKEWGTVRVV